MAQEIRGISFLVTPAQEAVRKLTIAEISVVHPTRHLPCSEEPPQAASRRGSFLRMRDFLNPSKDYPDAEERPEGASRSTHSRDAADFLTASQAGV